MPLIIVVLLYYVLVTQFIIVSGLEAWAAGKMEDFGMLITASGLSSIQNYECGNLLS